MPEKILSSDEFNETDEIEMTDDDLENYDDFDDDEEGMEFDDEEEE